MSNSPSLAKSLPENDQVKSAVITEAQRLRVLLGKLIEAQYEAALRSLEEYDRLPQAPYQNLPMPANASISGNNQKPQSSHLPRVPDNAKWNTTPKGMQWIFGDDLEAQALVEAIRARPNGTLVIDGYQYKLSSAKDGGRLFLNRWQKAAKP